MIDRCFKCHKILTIRIPESGVSMFPGFCSRECHGYVDRPPICQLEEAIYSNMELFRCDIFVGEVCRAIYPFYTDDQHVAKLIIESLFESFRIHKFFISSGIKNNKIKGKMYVY